VAAPQSSVVLPVLVLYFQGRSASTDNGEKEREREPFAERVCSECQMPDAACWQLTTLQLDFLFISFLTNVLLIVYLVAVIVAGVAGVG